MFNPMFKKWFTLEDAVKEIKKATGEELSVNELIEKAIDLAKYVGCNNYRCF